MHNQLKHLDRKEVQLPDIEFIWNIETKVFQSIAIQCLSKIEGVALLEGSFVDSLLGRDANDRVKGISIEQDDKLNAIRVKMEINVKYGVSIPQKAEEVQLKVAEDISRLTGLYVSSVHVVFKGLIPPSRVQEECVTSATT